MVSSLHNCNLSQPDERSTMVNDSMASETTRRADVRCLCGSLRMGLKYPLAGGLRKRRIAYIEISGCGAVRPSIHSLLRTSSLNRNHYTRYAFVSRDTLVRGVREVFNYVEADVQPKLRSCCLQLAQVSHVLPVFTY